MLSALIPITANSLIPVSAQKFSRLNVTEKDHLLSLIFLKIEDPKTLIATQKQEFINEISYILKSTNIQIKLRNLAQKYELTEDSDILIKLFQINSTKFDFTHSFYILNNLLNTALPQNSPSMPYFIAKINNRSLNIINGKSWNNYNSFTAFTTETALPTYFNIKQELHNATKLKLNNLTEKLANFTNNLKIASSITKDLTEELLTLIHNEKDSTTILDSLFAATNTLITAKYDNQQKLFITYLQKLTKLCLSALNAKPDVLDPVIKIRLIEIYIAIQCAELNLKANDADSAIAHPAKNELYLLEFTLKKMKKGLANSINKIDDEGQIKDCLKNMIPTLGGTILADSAELQDNSILLAGTEGFIGGLIIGVATQGQKFLNQTANRTLKVLKQYQNLKDEYRHECEFNILNSNSKTICITNQQIHAEIKELYKDLKQNKITKIELKDKYINLLTKIETAIACKDIRAIDLTMMVAKIKFCLPSTTKIITYRNSLADLLELLATLFKSVYKSNTESININNTLTKIYTQCYQTNLESSSIIKSPNELSLILDEMLTNSNWKSQIISCSLIHQAKFLVSQSSANEQSKKLLWESFVNKLSTNPDLKKHRTIFDAKLILVLSGGSLVVNAVAIISPMIATATYPLAAEGVKSGGMGLFNSIYFATSFGAPWRGTSVHESSTKQKLALSKLDINEFIKNKILNQNLDQKNLELIIINFTKNLNVDQDIMIKKILEYNIYHHKESVPLIYLLYDQAKTTAEKHNILAYYYKYSLIKANIPEQFNRYLSANKNTFNDAVLDYCKCLALIEQSADQALKITMSENLNQALIYAKTDIKSCWFILNKPNNWKNFAIRFVSGTITYLGAFAISLFATPFITPLGSFFATTGLFAAKHIFDQKYANSFNTNFIDQAGNNDQQKLLLKKKQLEPRILTNYEQNYLEEKLNKKNNDTVAIYVPRIIEFLEECSYDTNSALSNLNAVTKFINQHKMQWSHDDLAIIKVSLGFMIVNGKFKDIMQTRRSSHLYDLLYGITFGLIWSTSISPILQGTNQLTKYIIGPCFGIGESIISFGITKDFFYKQIKKIKKFDRWLENEEEKKALAIITQ